jgi:hypothetical protein
MGDEHGSKVLAPCYPLRGTLSGGRFSLVAAGRRVPTREMPTAPGRSSGSYAGIGENVKAGHYRQAGASESDPADRTAMSGSASTPYPAAIHASRPPARGLTSVYPLSMSARATRAEEASLGHVQ